MTNILTLHLDSASQAHFDRMREAHYPAHLNQIPAHLSLFHTLPDSSAIGEILDSEASSQKRFALRVTGLRSLGRGVAFTVASPELGALHARLADAFADDLTAQDRQRFQPHVVLQNKATPERAKVLLATLQAAFSPFQVGAEGLDLWHYLGGPWQRAAHFPFMP